MTTDTHVHSNSIALLWDLDGTLIDSAQLHWEAWEGIMEEEGAPIRYEQFIADLGKRNDLILRGYLGEDLSAADIDRIASTKEARYRELIRRRGLDLLPGARAWLERAGKQGLRQAVASSAPKANIETVLEVLGIGEFLETWVSADDVTDGKPAPDVFLAAARKLALPPARCIVIEDAPAGVEAGRRAGMKTVGVLTTHPDLDADLVVPTLEALPVEFVERLLT